MQAIYSPRLLEILRVLAKHSSYVSTQTLATDLGVSTRTIFREVQDVNTLLDSFNILLESKPGYGFRLLGNDDSIQRFIKTLESSYNTLPYRNVDERRKLLMIECLQSRELQKLSTLAQLFGISEGTVSRDLDVIEPWFEAYDLHLIRRQGYGVSIAGDEAHIRRAITDYVHQQLSENNDAYFEVYNRDVTQYFQDQESGILSLLDKDIVSNVIEVLENSSINISHRITEHSYVGLIIHLVVAVSRVQKGDSIAVNADILESVQNEPLLRDAKIIAGDIEDRFHIQFPETEVGYIFMHLRGTRPRHLQETATHETVLANYDCMVMVERLIQRFSNLVADDFTSDQTLTLGLMAHLLPTLNRIRFQLEIRNPLLEEIRTQYADLFEIVKETARILHLEDNIQMSEDEIGYLTLHFGAAIERRKHLYQRVRALNIGVVCASGIGISALLASKLKSTFLDAQDVVPLSVEQIERNDYADIDLLVATLEINATVPIVMVNPLLRNEDITNIRGAMDELKEADALTSPPLRAFSNFNMDIIESISCISIAFDRSKFDFIPEIVKFCENPTHFHDLICKEVTLREHDASVIIEDKHFVMYHASIPDTIVPEVVFFKNTSKQKHPDFQHLEIGVLMLLPRPAETTDRKTMSKISEAIIDYAPLMDAILCGNAQLIKNAIISYMEE